MTSGNKIKSPRTIAFLRGLEFPLSEIKTLLAGIENERQILDALDRQKNVLKQRMAQYKKIVRQLDHFINEERKAGVMAQNELTIQEKSIDPMMIASIHGMKGAAQRLRGKAATGRIARAFGGDI